MPRGESYPLGTERVSQNGYHYVKTSTGWRLKHWIVAEEKLGRPIDPKKERVLFADRNRDNFDPSNIIVEPKKGSTNSAKLASLKARRDELDAQIAELEEETA